MKSDTRGRWIGLGQGEIVWVFEPTHPFESPSKVMRRWGLLFGPEFNGPSLILKVGSFYGFPARRGKEDERLPMCSLLLLSSSSTLAVATAFWFSTPFHFCSTKHTLPILPFIHQFSSKLAQSPTSFPNLGFIVRKDLLPYSFHLRFFLPLSSVHHYFLYLCVSWDSLWVCRQRPPSSCLRSLTIVPPTPICVRSRFAFVSTKYFPQWLSAKPWMRWWPKVLILSVEHPEVPGSSLRKWFCATSSPTLGNSALDPSIRLLTHFKSRVFDFVLTIVEMDAVVSSSAWSFFFCRKITPPLLQIFLLHFLVSEFFCGGWTEWQWKK